MARPDFIYAGTPQEYELFLRDRPHWRGVPALISREQIEGRKGVKLAAVGNYQDRGDYDDIIDVVRRQRGEWV